MTIEERAVERLQGKIADLCRRLEEAEETIAAIRGGGVDAFVVQEPRGERVYALETADGPYRVLVENMQQGALVLATDGTVLFGNPRFAAFVGLAHQGLTGLAFRDFVPEAERSACDALLRAGRWGAAHGETVLARGDGSSVAAHVTVLPLPLVGAVTLCALVTDLTERKIIEQLRLAEDQLRRARDDLENRVRERTADLARALESLERETAARVQTEQARLDLLRRLVTVQEDERRRIARELHDEMGQHLTALALELKVLQGLIPDGVSARERLRRLQEVTGQLGKEVHRLAVELRPTSLDDMGLATTLANHLEEWAERTGVAVEFHRDMMDDVRAAAQVEVTLYRVVQETLTNVLKHAEAGRVCVVLGHQGGEIHLTVEDNGRGFDADAEAGAPGAGGRLGLVGMRERVAMVGGSLAVESSPGRHTTVFVRVPAFAAPEGVPDA